ncbi:hypothetical protein GE061_011473 [Apolygus lucorum]|uniref:Secreted protein n=1 Tax=Apolygus lucorum TaxID=248454 RepID=A0A8S9XZK0_APOLU|nr:hypothetical protein GE061_011473 [Apolygus lucorum]
MAGGLHLVLLAVVVLSVTSLGLGDDGSTTQESTKPEDQKVKLSTAEIMQLTRQWVESNSHGELHRIPTGGELRRTKRGCLKCGGGGGGGRYQGATHQVEGGKANDSKRLLKLDKKKDSWNERNSLRLITRVTN